MRTADKHLGTVIAERRLHVRGAPRHTAVVSLAKPRKTKTLGDDVSDWECPYRIAGAGIRIVGYGYGIDAFQALTNTLEGLRYHLDRSDMLLAWTGVFDNQTGFQRVIPLMPDARVSRRLERLVDREVERWGKEMKRRYEARPRRKRESHRRRI